MNNKLENGKSLAIIKIQFVEMEYKADLSVPDD